MDRTERFYKIQGMLEARGSVPMREFLSELEISPATFKRDLEYLRSRMNMPIRWDRERRGYRLDDPDPEAPRHELPGLWFNSAEVHALLTFYHLLDNLGPGLLAPHIKPLQERIRALLEKGDRSFEEIAHRIRVLPLAARAVDPGCFQTLAHALLERRRLNITHYSRSRDERSEREVSPQRLVHYRDNWYLDAWDHGKRRLRTFSVDTLCRAQLLEKKAREVPEGKLDAELAAGYGIFAGRRTRIARLRFTAERARWVAAERWHPKQKSRFLADGSYELCLPYSDPRELVMDVLKYGPDVEVLAPEDLRQEVKARLQAALRRY